MLCAIWSKMATFLWAVFLLLVLSTLQCSRGSYSDSWAVQVHGGEAEAARLATKHGFINRGKIGNVADHYHYVLKEVGGGGGGGGLRNLQSGKTHALLSESQVGYAEQQVIKKHVYRDYAVPGDPNWNIQWALKNDGTVVQPSHLDLNVEPAWLQGITGRGVVVALVDDGLERLHPDLKDNFLADVSYDFVDEDIDPTPDYSGNDTHGTSCAGEIGMAKNGVCGIGVAYESSIGGLKFNGSNSNDAIEARALGFQGNTADIYSNSWGPGDTGFLVEGPGRLVKQTFKNAVEHGRNGKGSVYVWAAGNGGDYFDSCAADGYASSIYTIAVGSADHTGAQAYYDEECSGKMAVTFSYNTVRYDTQISTTTVHGKCTDDFTGTSASAPLVSGVVALTLQANPELTWRDVQYLIAYTSNTELLTGGEWTTNGAGLKVSHKFGFGAIDAEAMVTRGRNWMNVPPQLERSLPLAEAAGNVSGDAPYLETFSVSTDIQFLEHVVLQVSLELHDYGQPYNVSDILNVSEADIEDFLEDRHPRRGDIELQLTSPLGTSSKLLPLRLYDFVNVEGYENWPFMSVHFWGEAPSGNWTVGIRYISLGGWVSVSDVSLVLYGVASVPESVQSIPEQCDAAVCARGCSATRCDVCSAYRNSSTLDCVASCTDGYTSYNGYCIEGKVIFPPSKKRVSTGLVFGLVCGAVVFVTFVCVAVVVTGVLIRKRRSLQRQHRRDGYQLAFATDAFDEQIE